MPVIDHPIHERVRIGQDFRYGCHNGRGVAPGFLVKDGIVVESPRINGEVLTTGRYRLKYVPHTMSTTCRYDMSLEDPACDGCRERGVGETYFKKVTEESK